MKVTKPYFLFLFSILFLSTYPIQTSQVQAQEKIPSIDFPGPYQIGYRIEWNISKTPGMKLPISIYYPAIEKGKDANIDKSNAPYPTIIFSIGFTTTPGTYRQYSEKVSSQGFIVVVVGSRKTAYATERSNDTCAVSVSCANAD